jgi:hypothetical protein
MNLAFIGPFKHAGLSLSIGLSACLNAGCLCYFLIKKKLYQPRDGWYGFLLKLLTAVIIMGTGWFYEAGQLQFYGCQPASTSLRVNFAIVPIESEIAAFPQLMAAAALMGVRHGLARITGTSMRELEYHLEGVPNIKGAISQIERTIRQVDKEITTILGTSHPEVQV